MNIWLILSGLALMAGSSPPAAPPGEETEHVVEAGETLLGIANRAGVPSSQIIAANSLVPPYVIRIGQKLTIPREGRPASRTVAAGSPSAPSPAAQPKCMSSSQAKRWAASLPVRRFRAC
jgi:LysM repeat protein